MTELVMVTDPIGEEGSRRVMQAISGWRRAEGSLTIDGTPTANRSVFVISHRELVAGGLEDRIGVLSAHGIAVHRILGSHPAVTRANRRLGYV